MLVCTESRNMNQQRWSIPGVCLVTWQVPVSLASHTWQLLEQWHSHSLNMNQIMIRSHFVLYWWNFKSYNIPFKSFWSPLFIHLEAQSVSSEIIFFSSLLLILYVFTDVVSRHCFLYLVFSLVFAYWFRKVMLVNIFRPSKTLYCYFFYWPWDWFKV